MNRWDHFAGIALRVYLEKYSTKQDAMDVTALAAAVADRMIELSPPDSESAPVEKEKLDWPVGQLDISKRAYRCFKHNDIETVGDLVRYSPRGLLRFQHFGRTSLRDVKRALAVFGLSLKGN